MSESFYESYQLGPMVPSGSFERLIVESIGRLTCQKSIKLNLIDHWALNWAPMMQRSTSLPDSYMVFKLLYKLLKVFLANELPLRHIAMGCTKQLLARAGIKSATLD